MRRIEDHVPIARLSDFFVCDPVAGLLHWKRREPTCYRVATWNKRFAGQVAGRVITDDGRVQIVVKVDGVRYHTVAHRVIWSMTTGEWVDPVFDVDHRNGLPADNRFPNLRVCLPAENAKNKGLYKNNTSGFKGVSWVDVYQKWGVQIHVQGGSKFGGYYDSPEAAAHAYDDLAMKHFGEFARTNSQMGLL